MTDTLGRILARVAAGAGGHDDPDRDYAPLAADVAHLVTSELNHLGYESTFRTLASIDGWALVDAPPPSATTDTVDVLLADIDWRSPELGTTGNACLGTHWIPRVATAVSTWPQIVLRARAEGPGLGASDTMGIYFAASPGFGTFPSSADPHASKVIVADDSWIDVDLSLTLETGDLASIAEAVTLGDGGASTSPLGEPLAGMFVTLWVGCYTTAGKGGLRGITVATEPPP